MKKINSLGKTLNVSLLLLFFFSIIFSNCKKQQTVPPDPPLVLPTIPSLDLKADTAWYGGNDTITITTNAQSVVMGGQTITGSNVVVTGVKNDSTILFTATNSNGSVSKSVTKSITVHAFSERMTFFCNNGPVQMTYNKSCTIDSVGNQLTPWFDGPADCNVYQFYPDGTASVTFGACNPDPGSTYPGTWSWESNETQILISGYDLWDMDSVNLLGWQRSHIVIYNSTIFKTVQKFTH